MKRLFLALSAGLASCTYHSMESIKSTPAHKDSASIPADSSWTSTFDTHSLLVNHAFDSGRIVGAISDPSLDEVSGIAASYNTPGSLWVEEDSGNPNTISLLTSDGKLLGAVSLDRVTNRDWEDMSIAPGPTDGVHYIYLADIGDNDKKYDIKYIYRFPEPPATIGGSISIFDVMSFSFPDGIKNCEAMMIDPLTKDIYVISKESGKAVVYLASYPQPLNKNFVLTKIGSLPISKVTAADISPDGTEILIKNYVQVFYWKRNLNQTISFTLKQNPLLLPYQIEEQGESICFAKDASGFYTTSEMTSNAPPPIYFYKRN